LRSLPWRCSKRSDWWCYARMYTLGKNVYVLSSLQIICPESTKNFSVFFPRLLYKRLL
jgi:hypothetical protein